MTERQRSPGGRLFSRPLNVDDVIDGGLDVRIEATPQERVAIAKEVGLPAVGSLDVDYHVERQAGGRFSVRGELRARITQICVVTLEPFESDKVQAIDVTFADAAPLAEVPAKFQKAASRRHESDRSHSPAAPAAPPISLDQEDPPDPLIDNTIDLGAVALEFLTLAQDLYPKKRGVHFTDMVTGEKAEETPSAFAALGRLKDLQ